MSLEDMVHEEGLLILKLCGLRNMVEKWKGRKE